MRKRVISTIRHPYTSKQILAQMLAAWNSNRHAPVLIIAPMGQVNQVVKNIRVTLAKERAKQGKQRGTNYGFTQTDPFPFTEDGVTGEAVVLRWRITALQNIRNIIDTDEIRKKTYA